MKEKKTFIVYLNIIYIIYIIMNKLTNELNNGSSHGPACMTMYVYTHCAMYIYLYDHNDF